MDCKRVLGDIKVVEMSEYLSGPYCAMVLGDLGAEVIKIERPGVGDAYRSMGPYFRQGESSAFMSLNRNKKSVAVNIKTDKGRSIVKELISRADVLIENYRPGTMERLGFGYKEMAAINQKLIYCSISGYGLTGPMGHEGGFDLIAQGITGLMDVTGDEKGLPAKVGIPITDFGAALYGVQGILAALHYRDVTGKGQMIESSLLESGTALQLINVGNYTVSGMVPKRMGSASPLSAPYQAFKTKDIYINIGTGSNKLWEKLCKVIDDEELISDPRFINNADRVHNREVLTELLEERLKIKSGWKWLELLSEVGIPSGPICSVDELLTNEQLLARDMIVEYDHPKAGTVQTVGYPIHFERCSTGMMLPPPTLGEHTESVLENLGYSGEEIQKIKEANVI